MNLMMILRQLWNQRAANGWILMGSSRPCVRIIVRQGIARQLRPH